MKKAVLGFGAMLVAALTAVGCGSETVPKLEDLQQSVNVDQTESQPQFQGSSESSKEEGAVMEPYMGGTAGAAGSGGADSGVASAGNGFENQILDQSFAVDLDDWGEVTFAAFEPEYLTKEDANGQVMYGDVRFGLIKDGEIIYNFPGYNEENVRYSQQFGQVVAVAFKDYDENGRMDILIINEYAGVQGPNIGVPFREARVYTQEDGETVFKLDGALSEYLVYYTDSMSEMYEGLECYAKGYSVATSKTAWTVERFAKEIKQFILGGDFEGLCDIISFPITVDGTVYQDGEAFMKADFVENPNPQFLEELKDETCENLFANYQGIMMGNGLVWFAEVSNEDRLSAKGLKVTSINGITGNKANQAVTAPEKDDYSGLYVDTQGTSDVYSELSLVYQEDGSYKATIGLYRITTLEGNAVVEGDILSFEDEFREIKGEIRIQDAKAVFTIIESEFIYIKAGEVFEFPEKR